VAALDDALIDGNRIGVSVQYRSARGGGVFSEVARVFAPRAPFVVSILQTDLPFPDKGQVLHLVQAVAVNRDQPNRLVARSMSQPSLWNITSSALQTRPPTGRPIMVVVGSHRTLIGAPIALPPLNSNPRASFARPISESSLPRPPVMTARDRMAPLVIRP